MPAAALSVFRVSAFEPPREWLAAAVGAAGAALRGVPLGGGPLAPADIASALAALAALTQPPLLPQARAATDGASAMQQPSPPPSSPEQLATARRLLDEALHPAHASGFAATDVLQVLQAARALGLGPHLASGSAASGGGGGLPALLGAAASAPPASLPPRASAALLRAVSDLGVRPGDTWVAAVLSAPEDNGEGEVPGAASGSGSGSAASAAAATAPAPPART
eukprot:309189-Chlamydomonas_euryale.AAC.1